MKENGFHQPENQFVLARISVTVSNIRNKLSNKGIPFKVDGFQRKKNPFPIAEMKDLFENTFHLDGKKLSLARVSEKCIKKWFVQSRASVSTTRNEAFVEKYISTIRKICFFWQENRRKCFPLAGKCLSFKIGAL